MHAGTVEAADWWARPRANNASWIETYQNSLKARHRNQVAGVIGQLQPTTVLEVGAHCGPNLVRLAQDFPAIDQLSGVDVNPDAVAAGRAWVERLGLSSRVELAAGRVPEMTQSLASGCVDVVLSCYALAYIAPADLDEVLYEMGRLAKRAVVIAEPMTDQEQAGWNGALTGYQEWAHNYRAASRWLQTWRGMTTRIDVVNPPVDRLNGILVAVRGEA